jgi:hypothetical protein
MKPKKKLTADDVGNQFGFLCPQCSEGTDLYISATMNVQAHLFPDGTDNDGGGDTEWDDASYARCTQCDWAGTVGQLKVAPNFEGE